MNDAAQSTISINYRFTFKDGSHRELEVRLDSRTLHIHGATPTPAAAWTRLESDRCANCPLDPARHTHCPIAAHLVQPLEFFGTFVSYTNVDTVIQTAERTYIRHAALQDAARSLMGIYMVSSGCPIMEKLKPMVRFHLPFATIEETTSRAVSMYLTAQYLRQRHGLLPDWELTGLAKMYDQVSRLNISFARRIRRAMAEDAGINAIGILDILANAVRFSVTEQHLEELAGDFGPYLE
jgi:hypothetical protein